MGFCFCVPLLLPIVLFSLSLFFLTFKRGTLNLEEDTKKNVQEGVFVFEYKVEKELSQEILAAFIPPFTKLFYLMCLALICKEK
jgi:hypothetical protein